MICLTDEISDENTLTHFYSKYLNEHLVSSKNHLYQLTKISDSSDFAVLLQVKKNQSGIISAKVNVGFECVDANCTWTSTTTSSEESSERNKQLERYLISLLFEKVTTCNFSQTKVKSGVAVESLHVSWLTDLHSYVPLKQTLKCKQIDLPIKHPAPFQCLNFSEHGKTKGSLLFLEPMKMKNEHKFQNYFFSWFYASKQCRLFGGSLPILSQKAKLIHLFGLMKLEKSIPPLPTIFIGLLRSKKVHLQ